MKSMRWWRIGAPGLLLLACPIGVATAHPSNHVIANGGLKISGSGRVLNGTIGQAVVGSSLGPANAIAHGFWAIGAQQPTGVDPIHVRDVPLELSFGLPRPNPARDAVRFGVSLPRASRVGLAVYDVAGREVGEYLERGFAAGNHSLEWKAAPGRTGIFFARLLVNGRLAGARRIVLVQ